MPKFLVQACYMDDGAKGLIKEGGTSRRTTVERMAQRAGGRVEGFYYAYGDTDLTPSPTCPMLPPRWR